MHTPSLGKMATTFQALMIITVHQRIVREQIHHPFNPTNESTADIIKKKLKDVIDKNSAVSVKFVIFNPTIPSAICKAKSMTSVAIAPVIICFSFNKKFSFLVPTGILLIAIK